MKRLLGFCLALLLLAPAAAAAEAEEAFPIDTSAWAREEVMRAINLNILYDPLSHVYQTGDPITRGDFAANAAALAAVEFGSNLESYLLITRYRGQAEREEYYCVYALDAAKNLGILQGRGDGEEDTQAYITRQEAAVMLARTYRAYQTAVPSVLEPLSFSDRDEIADWALDDVRLMNQLGVMTGVGGGRFDPLGSYTVEQCLISLLRLHEKAPCDGSKENPLPIPKREAGFFKTWGEGYDIAFAIETEDYYICALDRSTASVGLLPYYDIHIVNDDLSVRSYPTPILTQSSTFRGEIHARPENPALSGDGTALSYTATLEEDAYSIFGLTEADKTLIFPKGVYTVTMDLATGAQTWTRADLP